MTVECAKQQVHPVHDRLAGGDPSRPDRIEMNWIEIPGQPREGPLVGHPEAKRRHRAAVPHGDTGRTKFGRSWSASPLKSTAAPLALIEKHNLTLRRSNGSK